MIAVVDEYVFPFHRLDAQALHRALVRIAPAQRSAMLLAEQAGLDTSMIDSQQAPYLLWANILRDAAVAGLTRQLVEQVMAGLQQTSPFRPTLAAVLQDQPVPGSGAPRGADGAPVFIVGDDTVMAQEALLYKDDLTVGVGTVPALIATLQHLVRLSPSVCKVTASIGGKSQFGTAFRIGPDRLLTNWHVLHGQNGMRATAVQAEFGYEDDGAGGFRTPTAVNCDPASVVGDLADDWAVATTTDPLAPAWPVIGLEPAAIPRLTDAAFIIQHPAGALKRVSVVRNQVSFVDDRVVQYLADTQAGSSGAPVFNAHGELIALHHAGGRPQDAAGKAPVVKNEGIRITRVIAKLTQHG